MFSSVDDVKAGDRESVRNRVSGNVSIMLVERNAFARSTSLSDGKRN
jgi:hypothetical protein